MRRADARAACKGCGHRIADAAVSQPPASVVVMSIAHRNGRKEVGNRCARAYRLMEAHAVRLMGAEVHRLPAGQIVADDAEPADAVVETVEGGGFELTQPSRNHTAPPANAAFEPILQPDVDTVG